jgi:hypothetical protein
VPLYKNHLFGNKKLMMKIKFLVFSFLFFTFNLIGGDIITVVNSKFFSSGEFIDGSIFFKDLNTNGKILKCALYDKDLKQINHKFSIVENNKLSLQFYVDYEYPSGMYYIEVTVLDIAKKREIPISSIPILILNPSNLNNIDVQYFTKKNNSILYESTNKISAYIQNDQLIISPASFNIVQIVVNDDLYEGLHYSLSSNIKDSDVVSWSNKQFVVGQVKQNDKISIQSILGFYSNNDDKFIMSKTDKFGNAVFQFDTTSSIHSYQFKSFGPDGSKIHFEPNHMLTVLDGNKESFISSDKLSKLIEDVKIKSILNQYFEIKTILPFSKSFSRVEQSLKPFKTYLPSNYKNFEFFNEFCSENNLALKFKINDKKKFEPEVLISGVYAKKFNVEVKNPLFIVNGLITNNFDAIARLKTLDIEKIEIFMDIEALRKPYKIFGSETVIKLALKTDPNLLSSIERKNIFIINGLEKGANSFDFNRENNSLKKYPIFASKILFERNFENPISIALPDNNSYFLISILTIENDNLKAYCQKLKK